MLCLLQWFVRYNIFCPRILFFSTLIWLAGLGAVCHRIGVHIGNSALLNRLKIFLFPKNSESLSCEVLRWSFQHPEPSFLNILDRVKFVRKSHLGMSYEKSSFLSRTVLNVQKTRVGARAYLELSTNFTKFVPSSSLAVIKCASWDARKKNQGHFPTIMRSRTHFLNILGNKLITR